MSFIRSGIGGRRTTGLVPCRRFATESLKQKLTANQLTFGINVYSGAGRQWRSPAKRLIVKKCPRSASAEDTKQSRECEITSP